jgi:DNA polymerase III sliding clamp (beta) subunit (PCNA family)
LATVARREASRYALAALHVRSPGGGLYRVEATDGRILAVVQGPVPDASYPPLEDRPEGDAEVLLSRDDWQRAFRLGDRRRPVGLSVGQEDVLLAVGDQALTTRALDGRFPDVSAVLPRSGALVAVRLNPTLLVELLKVAAAVTAGEGVDLLFFGRGKPLGLMARNDSGQTFDGLIMPLT